MHDERHHPPLTPYERALARRGEELVAAAVSDTKAPQSLRESIERERARAQAPESRAFLLRHARGLIATTAVAAVMAAATISLLGSDSEAPTYASVEAAAELAPTAPAPASLGGDPPVLAARVGALEFPVWRESFGWTATGRSAGEVAGRAVTTVHYRNERGARLGYAVLAGDALGGDPPGRRLVRDGKPYDVTRDGDRTVVTWTQQGHTCVIVASAGVSTPALVELAASRNA